MSTDLLRGAPTTASQPSSSRTRRTDGYGVASLVRAVPHRIERRPGRTASWARRSGSSGGCGQQSRSRSAMAATAGMARRTPRPRTRSVRRSVRVAGPRGEIAARAVSSSTAVAISTRSSTPRRKHQVGARESEVRSPSRSRRGSDGDGDRAGDSRLSLDDHDRSSAASSSDPDRQDRLARRPCASVAAASAARRALGDPPSRRTARDPSRASAAGAPSNRCEKAGGPSTTTSRPPPCRPGRRHGRPPLRGALRPGRRGTATCGPVSPSSVR